MIIHNLDLIKTVAKIVDYKIWLKDTETYNNYLKDGKSEAEARKMADYHWLTDKEEALYKAQQILNHIDYHLSQQNVFRRIWKAIML